MLTAAEEQGFDGARALAEYCVDEGIQIAAILNNDVIDGIICGETSSPPSCPTEGEIDNTQVRIFSARSASINAYAVVLIAQEVCIPTH